jgi:Tfp pilus assembly protein PilF
MAMKVLTIALAAALLAACATTPVPRETATLFVDARFGARPELPSRDAIFTLPQQARAQLRRELAGSGLRLSPHRLLPAFVQTLQLDYDTAVTRTAAQAFEARAGNCLSLVILAGALAAELNVPVVYQSVHGYETWSRGGGINFLSGHVNLRLEAPEAASGFGIVAFDRPLVIDFVDSDRAAAWRARPITESTVVAMFRNNRAAETLAAGDTRGAYWWTRAAIEADPGFFSAYNTLAVIYQRADLPDQARRVLEYALRHRPDDAQMLSNLVRVLQRQGHMAEARTVERRLAEVAAHPPFWFLDRGNERLALGDAAGAMHWYRRELRRMPYDHELHFAIAVASAQLGDLEAAREHLALAQQHSGSRERRAIYAAKLDRLAGSAGNEVCTGCRSEGGRVHPNG